MEWGLEAFANGSREVLAENLTRDPRTRSENQAREAVNTILSIPEYADMAARYK